MSNKNLLPPEEHALAEMLQQAARQVEASPSFRNDLEKKIMNAHKPKAGVGLFSIRKIAAAAGWTFGFAALALIFIWVIRSIATQPQPATIDTPFPVVEPSTVSCPVTAPNGSLPPGETNASEYYLGNGKLWTSLWPDGKVYMEPYNQKSDGSFSMKWGWVRGVSGPLSIEGRRLDADAEPLRAFIPSGYGETGFQVSELIFPTVGCWEVTGHVGDASLTFITQVLFGVGTPTPAASTAPLSTPEGMAYELNGQTLYLNAPLPEEPVEMKIYLTRDEVHATVEDVKTLADQFGMSGEIYEVTGEAGGTTNYLAVDGNQRLRVRSNRYFTYYPDQAGMMPTGVYNENPNAEALINEFMQEHGFNFEYRIEQSQLFGAYLALPLTPDGFALHHEHFKFSGMMFYFNWDGIEFVDVSLLSYDEAATVGIISAEEAFQKLLDPITGNGAGVLMGMSSGSGREISSWQRAFPLDQTITYFGYMNSTGKSITGGTPLATLDGYIVTGNIEGVTENMQNVFVEVTGQIHEANGVKTFEFQSWKVYDGYDEGYQGTIQREGEQFVINTTEGYKLILPDMPSDVPLPLENAYIMGVTQGDTFEWKSFDTRMAQGGGGGGGGGGVGFYKLNLTGTPVPFPTPAPVVESPKRPAIGEQIDGIRGIFTINIFKQADGSQRYEYNFVADAKYNFYPYMKLEGMQFEEMRSNHNKPIEVWGTVARYDPYGNPVINLDHYEIPYPDLQFQSLHGTQSEGELQGNIVVFFTSDDGTVYVQLNAEGDTRSPVDNTDGIPIYMQALIIPDEKYENQPTLRALSFSEEEESVNLAEPFASEEPPPIPTLSIEKVDLVYYMPDSRYITSELVMDQRYLQPVWRFYGHYSSGDEFEYLIQALKNEFLLPELAPYTQPG